MFNVVWFKRDLRLSDHSPLLEASRNGLPTLLLFLVEPMLLNFTSEYSNRHWNFMFQSLAEMNRELKNYNLRVHAVEQNALEFFKELYNESGDFQILSHMETGQACTFVRDVQVLKWTRENNLKWKEYRQFGVTRGRKDRDDWAIDWDTFMAQLEITIDFQNIQGIEIPKIISAKYPVKARPKTEHPDMQLGGSSIAFALLDSFLKTRYKNYSKHISKPLQSRVSCSRLSPYISWGCISMRQISLRIGAVYKMSSNKRALSNYKSRLYWHCHFIQKLESEPRIEFENQNRMYDVIRTELNEDFLQRWSTGNTGYPMIDASMRCLVATGYINFRMRAAMLSLWTHHLFQPWKPAATHLARQFMDYEPGIHFPQVQMQAGTVGYHTIRIYNPTKQAKDHDPEAIFIKTWCPELINLPTDLAHEPWKVNAMEEIFYEYEVGKTYPNPICDLEKSGKYAREEIHKIKNQRKTREIAKQISKVHVNQKQL